jgi:hypothetical protein
VESVGGRDVEHTQVDCRIFMPRKSDVPDLAGLLGFQHHFKRPSRSEESIGVFHPDVFMILNQIHVVDLQPFQQLIDLFPYLHSRLSAARYDDLRLFGRLRTFVVRPRYRDETLQSSHDL